MRTEPRLHLDERFTHLVDGQEAVVLVEDEDAFLLEDAVTSSVVRLLDGRRTAVDVASALADVHPAAEVHYVLLKLLEAGLVHEGDPRSGSAEERSRGTPLATRLAELWEGRRTPVVVVPPGTWAGPDGMLLVLTDDYLRPELASVATSLSSDPSRPMLLVGLGARRMWLGPVISAGASCITCLRDRLLLNLSGRGLLHAGTASADAAFEVVPLPSKIPNTAFDRLAELLSVAETPDVVADHLLVVGLAGEKEARRHWIPRLPHCPACGNPDLSVPGPDFTLASRPRTVADGTGYRIVPPEVTLARYAHLVSPLVGVVRRLRKLPVERADQVHVYTAAHAHHYGAGTLRSVKDDRRDHSGGKGRSDAAARASALCESLERFSSVHRGDEHVTVARRSLLGPDTLAPNDLMHFSARQYAEREDWNRHAGKGFHFVPEPYDNQVIAWSWARDLGTGRVRALPAAFLYFGYRGWGSRYCAADSNGLAGGNCLEEAILQGFLEVAERDAIALWWYNRAPRPEVTLEVDDPWIRDIVALYRRMDRDVWALDLTTDLGIPTYAAVSALRRDEGQNIIFGFGAHLDPRIALTRALAELNQMLPHVLRSPEERRRRLLPDFEDAVRWWEDATLMDEPYLLPARDAPRWPVLPCGRDLDGDLGEDIVACVERAAAVGCDVLVHDLTRPDVGFPVVKVIVPGLRHFWRRLGPGRLYDVPVRLGWTGRATPEDEMNRRSVFV